jgi:hypothetical protein
MTRRQVLMTADDWRSGRHCRWRAAWRARVRGGWLHSEGQPGRSQRQEIADSRSPCSGPTTSRGMEEAWQDAGLEPGC